MAKISKKALETNRFSLDQAFEIEGIEYIKSAELNDIEMYLLEKTKELDLEISVDVLFDEPLNFKTLVYSKYAGSIIMYPLSQEASDLYIHDVLLHDTYEDYVFPEPKDKYILKQKQYKKKITHLVILPGSNIIKSIVNRHALEKISTYKDVVVKLHPLTEKFDEQIIRELFYKHDVVGQEYGLYNLFEKAENIYTSSTSEAVLYSALSGKNLKNIDEQTRDKKVISNYNFLTKAIFGAENQYKISKKILNSEISCIFNPSDPHVFEKINNYIKYIKEKHKIYVKRAIL